MSTSDPEVLLGFARQELANGQFALAEAKCLQLLSVHRHRGQRPAPTAEHSASMTTNRG